MRHQYNKLLKMNTGDQKKDLIMRNLMTSLVKNGEITTTSKRAKILKSEVDKFFARLMKMFDMYADEKDVRREAIRLVKSVIFGEEEGKKVVDEMLLKYKEKGIRSGFVRDFKLGVRPGDNAEKVLIRLV